MESFSSRKYFHLLILFFLLMPLFFLTRLIKEVQRYLITARGQPANIVVDATSLDGGLFRPWQALAQGGEENDPQTLTPVLSEVKALSPQYIRLDHLFDFYQVVTKDTSGNLVFDWSNLDQVVDSIIQAGALPFFSLSYIPPVIAEDGEITKPPQNWLEWQLVVQKTIEHYSGKNEKNLNLVYYEVFNEPDLFGQWRIGKDPDYRLLYYYAERGASKASKTNSFKIGGPAITHFRKDWLDGFLDYIEKQKLRLDFISWHTYSPEVERFVNDFSSLYQLIHENPSFAFQEIIISEWGSDSENSSWHDGYFDAAHTVAVVRQLLNRLNWAFSFEIKDGPSPEGKKFWGRWGLLTHQKFGVEKKPRFLALYFLNQLGNFRLKLDGEGTWVTGLAAKKERTNQLLLVNYDSRMVHQEAVPVKLINLELGKYQLKKTFLGQESVLGEITVTDGKVEELIFMPENSVLLLELTPLF